jgi:dethiobiotin synthetase
VANILDPEMPRLQENIDTLKQCINEPCLGTVPRLDDLSAERVADFLTVPGQ